MKKKSCLFGMENVGYITSFQHKAKTLSGICKEVCGSNINRR